MRKSDSRAAEVVFISTSEKARLTPILQGLKDASVLTVGEMDRFTESGGMINFVKQGGKVRFVVNSAAVEAGGLKMSAELLQVAIPVTPDATKGEP